MLQLPNRSFSITPQTEMPLRISLLAFPSLCSAADGAPSDGTCCAPAFQEWKLSLRAGVPEHGKAEQSLIHLLLTGAAGQSLPMRVSSHSAQCRRGQGVKAPVSPELGDVSMAGKCENGNARDQVPV